MLKSGVRELKAQLSQQLKRVQRGGRLTIIDRGKPTSQVVIEDRR